MTAKKKATTAKAKKPARRKEPERKPDVDTGLKGD